MPERLFAPGEAVVMRHVRGAWRWAAPMHVVEDRGDFVALYLQPGSTFSTMGDADGNLTRDFVNESTPLQRTWAENHSLHLVRFGDEHKVLLERVRLLRQRSRHLSDHGVPRCCQANPVRLFHNVGQPPEGLDGVSGRRRGDAGKLADNANRIG